MSRYEQERDQDERISELAERVAFLEGESTGGHGHHDLGHGLRLIHEEVTNLAVVLAELAALSAEQTELLLRLAAEHEPKGFITINAGPVTEIR